MRRHDCFVGANLLSDLGEREGAHEDQNGKVDHLICPLSTVVVKSFKVTVAHQCDRSRDNVDRIYIAFEQVVGLELMDVDEHASENMHDKHHECDGSDPFVEVFAHDAIFVVDLRDVVSDKAESFIDIADVEEAE